jgi:hypothetical protein
MAVYAITGKLGSGKGKAGIQRLREYLRAGKRVATNCDVFLEHMADERTKSTAIRIPDKPTSTDLYMLGSGNRYVEFETNIQHMPDGSLKGFAPKESPRMLPGFDESHNGCLVLDECGSWLNTRDFQNKNRADLLEWAIHARKYGWDIFFIMQNISQIDKQIRESLFEYVVRLNRLDRMRVPLLSPLIQLTTAGSLTGAMPRLHIAVVRLGASPDGLVADRWVFRGDDLHQAYNTTQVFSESYPHGVHSLLSPWHLSAKVGIPPNFVGPVRPGTEDHQLIKPRAKPLKPPHKHMSKFLMMALLLGGVLGYGASSYFGSPIGPAQIAAVEKKYSDTLKPQGLIINGGLATVMLSDGTAVKPLTYENKRGIWEAEISPGVWVKGIQ